MGALATPKTGLDKGKTNDARFMFMEGNVRNLVLSGTWGQKEHSDTMLTSRLEVING